MSEEQAVVEQTDEQAKPASEGAGAQDDLDSLLKEFEQPVQETKSDTKTETKPDGLEEVISFVREQKQAQLADSSRKALNEAVKTVKGDLKVDDELVEGFLHARASKDQRIAQAWVNRDKNPQAFASVLKTLGKELSGKFADMPDSQVTEDRAAVAAAVRGASTKASESPPPDYSKMSDAEFKRHKESLA